jgi:TonB-dependent SusC/RagA subfamily outer membrane receptor
MKQKIYTLYLGLILICLSSTVIAQNISGTVKAEEDGLGIPGVSVVVKGTTRATITDIDGNYSIDAKKGETIVFSLVGYQPQEVFYGDATPMPLEIMLKGGNQQLGEFVVTALGITEDKRKLGYGVQQVSGDELASTQRDNFMDALQGRVAGLMTVPSSGGIGSSSLIVLRGVSSIGGNNQPLIVVDGLPIDNTTFSQGNLVSDRPNRDNDFLNRAADINPNDIASISILKGPEAAALYGSQGSSGAIVITTKKGTKGRGKISYDNSFGWDNVYRLPKLQSTYLRGWCLRP